MAKFLAEHASALFALAGIVIGAGLSFLRAWVMKGREMKLRLREKVLDRRIQAHEQVIELVKPMRTMVLLGYREDGGEMARTPAPLQSAEAFEQWHSNHYSAVRTSTTWLATEVKRELNLFQDYIVNLTSVLSHAEGDDYTEIGRIIRNDFISFSERIEKLAFEFFESELTNLELNSLQDWHKYPKEKTVERLEETELMRRKDEVNSIVDHEAL
jgi:hypothetical protein